MGIAQIEGVRLTSEVGGLRRQLRDVLLVFVAGAGMVLFFVGVAAVTGEEFRFLAKEPAETLGARKHIGAFAHTVVLLWAPAAATGVLAGLLHRRVEQRGRSSFYLVAGVLSVALLLDDLFLLHESFYPQVGIPQVVVYAIYAVVAITFVLRYLAELVETRALLMVLAGGLFLAASIGFDLHVAMPRTVHVLEDGSKAIGVAMWTVAITRAAVADLQARPLS